MYSISSLDADLPVTGKEQDIIEGDCIISKQHLVDESGMSYGVWQVSPGTFRSYWEGWEAFTVLSGKGTLTDDAGTVHELKPGALIVVPPDSHGVWTVEETLRKTWVFPKDSVGR